MAALPIFIYGNAGVGRVDFNALPEKGATKLEIPSVLVLVFFN